MRKTKKEVCTSEHLYIIPHSAEENDSTDGTGVDDDDDSVCGC